MKMNVTVANQTMEVEIGDLNARPIMAKIGDETFEVWPEDKAAPTGMPTTELSAARTGNRPTPFSSIASGSSSPSNAPANGSATTEGKAETAPLPGVIIGIAVKPGDPVKPGQALMDIEAMKMKNTIYASNEAVVAEILVSVGDSVRHGQILLKYT
jgi:glutaconyl-CoA/methylmalonyl-CoA decarboxylase subunit gamma